MALLDREEENVAHCCQNGQKEQKPTESDRKVKNCQNTTPALSTRVWDCWNVGGLTAERLRMLHIVNRFR